MLPNWDMANRSQIASILQTRSITLREETIHVAGQVGTDRRPRIAAIVAAMQMLANRSRAACASGG